MKRYRSWLARNQKRCWSVFITALVLVLALIGSYQYYSDPSYAGAVVEERLWSSVFYSALKLYAFSATVETGTRTPFFYELARWLAPFCTAYWVLQLMESFFRHHLCALRHLLSRKERLLIFGYQEKSGVFLQNLLAEKRRNITLVVEKPLDKELRLSLEREHVLIRRMDLTEDGGRQLSQDLGRLHLKRTAEVVLFHEEPERNLELLTCLLKAVDLEKGPEWDRLDGRIYCAVWCEDRVMQKLILDYYAAAAGRKPFDLHLFNMSEIAADALLEEHPVYENCLSWAKERRADGTDFLTRIPLPHVLIVGFGPYGQAVLERTLLTGLISDRSVVPGYERLRITIVDKDIKSCRDYLETHYPAIDRVCALKCIEGDAGSARVIRALSALPRITYAVICLARENSGINIMDRLQSYLEADAPGEREGRGLEVKIPIAIRMKNDDAVIRYCYERRKTAPGGPLVAAFGTDRKILTYDHLIKSRLEEAAKRFNAVYQEIAGDLDGNAAGAGAQALWNQLSFEHKDSSRAQALNVPYVQALLKELPPLPPRAEILRKDARALLNRLDSHPVLESLAAWEHRRWCCFCYAYGYAGFCEDPREKGKERWLGGVFGRVHPCLVEDWDKCRQIEYIRDTIIYDVCAIYAYAEAS